MATKKLPLSIRNNNPGNLRFAGQKGATKGEGGYAKFETPEAGLEALNRQLILDTQKRALTLDKFISKYAPQSENDTSNYLGFLSKELGINPTDAVPEDKLPDLMKAITKMEGGNNAFKYFYQPATQMAAAETSPVKSGSMVESFLSPNRLSEATVSPVASSSVLSIPLEGRYLAGPTSPVDNPVMAQATPISPRDFVQSDDPFVRSSMAASMPYSRFTPQQDMSSPTNVLFPDWWDENPLMKRTI